MTRFDITFSRLIIVLAGLIIVVTELCLLLDVLLTGIGESNLALARGLILVAGLLVIVLALRGERR